jgi:hypothetical protein
MLAPGQVWMKKKHSVAVVRQIISIEGKRVHYQVLHNPTRSQQKNGTCRLQTFTRDFHQIEPMKDYTLLDGAKQFDTYVVNATSGKPLFRCNEKRALWYLNKGYVTQAGDHQLQFNNDVTEQKLQQIYKGNFSDFFMAVKNDKCNCCGKKGRLSRHHIIPQCYKKKIPLEWRKRISNVLFICIECHKSYDHEWEPQEPNVKEGELWEDYILAWKNHFMEVMKPKFLPAGWDIFTQPV